MSGLLKHRIRLRDPVFGIALVDHLAKTGRKVPLIVERCCEAIERQGVVTGIYRQCGIQSNIQKLRAKFDAGSEPDLFGFGQRDIYSVSSLLKQYFRQLPNPLFTFQSYAKILRPKGVTDTPDALAPPKSLTWLKGDDDYDIMGMTGPAPRSQPPPPPPQQFIPVGRSPQRAINRVYHNPNAITFVKHQATVPPLREDAQNPQEFWTPAPPQPQFWTQAPPQQYWTPAPPAAPPPQPYWNWAPPTAAPIIPATPPPVTPASPQLLAHNTARMIREIATFSDVHHGANDNYGAVQTLMEAFFQSLAEPQTGAAAQDPIRPVNLQPLYDGTEMGANRPLTNQLFESDMVLTVEQMKGVVLASRELRHGRLRRVKRKVITGAVYRWPRAPIPYRFKEGDEKWRNLIRSALKHWESETCVRWEENGRGKDHVIFFRGSGCYSSVGRTGGSQMISIGYGCEDKGVIAHEVGHSLGFWHEQSRPDRDKYISLNKQFIIRGTDGNFERRTTQEIEDMGLPYDMGSVMHYGSNAFTKDWNEITIRTNDPNYQRTIGQRGEPSFIDVKQVNRLYCNGICSPIGCQNGGYPDPNNCNRCKCPKGLGGKTCEEIPQDSGHPVPKPPPSVWVPGSENRGFRGGTNIGGPIEKFILNVIPKVRDPSRPWESIASIVTEYSVASLLGIRN
ncbi:Metalloendopeptidase [Trichostrongylus colubriformis]|uniref:Metalloendopeptidase n=1 Tax=Trichostrongylus colubriformis TaxID=6319 RepID=A0AAN8FYU7_TRICO